MAGAAERLGQSPGISALTAATIIGCVLAAYVFLGAPGLWQTPLGAIVPKVDPAQGWLPAWHFLFAAGALSGGAWLASVLRPMARPGLVPLILFCVFQFALLATALANFSVAIAAWRVGEPVSGIAFLFVALVAMRVHPDLYMAILRLSNWVRSFHVSEHSPLAGGGLIALTIACNLVPLALTFQALTTHSGAMLATLFRRAVIDPNMYWSGILAQATAISTNEQTLALGAAGLSLAMGAIWALSRQGTIRQLARAQAIERSLRPEQASFLNDAVPAAIDAVNARASARRFTSWALVWTIVVVPVLLATAYAAFMWFDLLQERHALSWVTSSASDFTPFASGETGVAHYLIPAALALIAFTMGAPMSQAFFSGARYDHFAFGQPVEAILRAKLAAAVKAGSLGPGQAFDATAFADAATRRVYWVRVPLAILAVTLAAASGFWDVARGVAFTGDGLIVQKHYFAPPVLVRYHEVQAISLDCRIDSFGARPVYELMLPGGRVVDMIGAEPLPVRLDQYLDVDRRLQFSGVGYAYPPGDLEPCLIAIQKRYNSVIAAGTGRLLHVLD